MNYENLMEQLIAEDDRIIVMTAENRAAIRGLPAKVGKKFIDTGITEQTMVGMATGLAIRGRKPIIHALACFLTMRAYEFIRTDVGISGSPVKLVGGVAGFLSDANGPTHQAIEDVAIMRGIPPMGVFCPSDEQEMLKGLPSVIASEQPFYIRYNNLPAAVERPNHTFEIGKAEVFGAKTATVTLLTYGFLLTHVLKAQQILEANGITTRVVNMRTLKPIDTEEILHSVKTSDLVVTIEDHFLVGGLYSIVAETLLTNGVTGKVKPIALENKWFKPALLKYVLEHEGYTGEQLATRVTNFLHQ
jgi:transketolase